MKKKLYLICAQPRSGSTLLLRLLNATEGITISGENGGAINHLLDFYHYGTQLKFYQRDQGTFKELEQEGKFMPWLNHFSPDNIEHDTKRLIEEYLGYGVDQGETIGFKEVCFGDRPYEDFKRHLNQLNEWYDVKLVLLTRSLPVVEQSCLDEFGSVPDYLKRQEENFVQFYQEHQEVSFLDYSDLLDWPVMKMVMTRLDVGLDWFTWRNITKQILK